MSAITNTIATEFEFSRSAVPMDVVGRIYDRTGPLPQLQLLYESEPKLLWLVMRPEPKPVFTLPLIESVRKVQIAIEEMLDEGDEMPVSVLAFKTAGPFFSLGGDLDFYLECLAKRDPSGLTRYARIASEVIETNHTGLGGRVVTVSAVHARALGGGIDPARACHLMVAEESANFCYPEINYNHFPIAAVPILARRIGVPQAERILLSGATYTAEEFKALGVVDVLLNDGGSSAWIRDFARKAAPTFRARLSISAAFDKQGPSLMGQLAEATTIWVDHMMSLSHEETFKLARITRAQEKMLRRDQVAATAH